MDEEKLRAIWNWLPAFRAVAETEHLPTAARRLHVTAPAVSRSVKLVEEYLEVELFNRAGGRLILNGQGQELLAAVQAAMGDLDRAVEGVTEEPLSGTVRVSTLGVLTDYFVCPALLKLTGHFPRLIPRMENHRPAEANMLLRQGQLDVAFYYERLSDDALDIESLGTTTASIYCGPGHALFDDDDVELEAMLNHPFSVPQIGDSGQIMDGWPIDLVRKVGMRISLLTTNLTICRSGRFLTVLPDVVAYDDWQKGSLKRLPFDLIDEIPLFGAVRRREGADSAARVVMNAVVDRVEEVTDVLATAQS